MTFKTREITVDLVDDVSVPNIKFSQGDENSAKLILNLTNQGQELDLSKAKAVRITFKKPDGTTVFQEDCQPINAMKGKYQIILKTQTLAAAGNVLGQVRIIEPDGKLDAEPFGFYVKKSFSGDESIESTNEFGFMQKFVEASEKLEGVDIPALVASEKTANEAKEAAAQNANQIGILSKDLSKQDVKTQLLQHGANIVNATVASPLNVEIQGRSLNNLLGQTAIDPTKYYLFVPNKGTTKITVGGSSYDVPAKFTGQSTIAYTIKQNLQGKVPGSVIENGHIMKVISNGDSVKTPTDFTSEAKAEDYVNVNGLDGKTYKVTTTAASRQAQILVVFDIIRMLQDKFGSQIWQGKTALADKLTIAKQYVTDYSAIFHMNGSGPKGNKVYMQRWIQGTSSWFGSTNNTASVPTRTQTGSSNTQEIDNNGLIQVIAYTDASDAVTPSTISLDHVEFELKIKIDMPMLMLEDSIYEVDQSTYNKINIDPEFTGKKLTDKFPYVEGIKHLNPILSKDNKYLITNIYLAGQGGINDVLYKEDEKWKVLRKWKIDKTTNAITKLTDPIVEVAQVEGGIVVNGATQVAVDSGAVVREKVSFDTGSKKGVLNKDSAKVIAVYKELDIEPFTTYAQNGQAYPQLVNNVDSTKNYYVTYLLMNKHKYTTNAVDVKSTYNQSIRSTVDELTVKQSDTITGLSILQVLMTDVLARLKANSL